MNEMTRTEALVSAEQGQHDRAVGLRVRALRKGKSVSLQQLSAASGLSIGYLSQIERGISSASVRALALIADGLGVGLDAIFPRQSGANPATDAFAFRVSERRGLGFWRDGIEKALLTPGEDTTLNLFLVHVAPGGTSGESAYTHHGNEAGFVLEGAFELMVDGETRIMETGDAFRFRSNRPHRWRNIGLSPCQILWVLSGN